MRTVAAPASMLTTGYSGGVSERIPGHWGVLLVLITLALRWVSEVSAHPPDSVWHTDGPADETVYAIAVEPSSTTNSYVYAGTTNGVYKADSATLSWSSASNGLPTNTADGTPVTVLSLAIDPQLPRRGLPIVYAGTNQLGTATTLLFRSTDGGATWAPTSMPVPSDVGGIFGLALDPTPVADPQTQRTLYVATFGGAGIYKSTDSGTTFHAASSGLGSAFVTALALHVTPPNVHSLYAGTSFAGVYKSTNGGASWTAVNTGLPSTPGGIAAIESLAVDPTTPHIVYVGTGVGVYRTSDGGATWSAANTGLTSRQVTALVIDLTTSAIYVGTTAQGHASGIFKSTNGGSTWSPLTDGLTDSNIQCLAADFTNPGRLYAGTSGDGVLAIQQAAAIVGVTVPSIPPTDFPLMVGTSKTIRTPLVQDRNALDLQVDGVGADGPMAMDRH